MEEVSFTGRPPLRASESAMTGGYDPDDVLDAAVEMAPGRRAVLQQLLAAAGPAAWQPALPAVFVYGPTGAGKTHTVSALLQCMGSRVALVNCVETYTTRLLYEHVLNTLSGDLPSEANLFTGHGRCDTMQDFLTSLTDVIDASENPHHTTFLVFDRCERLRDFKPTMLAALLRIPELTNRNVCCIFISTLIWSKFQGGTGAADPLQVHVPAYDKAATVTILAQRCPTGIPATFFSRFVELMWDVFHGPCRDLNELGHLVTLLFPVYRRPVDDGEVEESNMAALYKRLAPMLKDQLSKLYLRETSTAEWQAQRDEDTSVNVSARLELPFHAKFLLLAAYLASHNPARTDQRYFAKQTRTKGRRTSAKRPVHSASEAKMIKGPAVFPLDRILAIFYSINDSRVRSTSEIYSQIKSLVSLRLLQQTTTDDNIDAPKYKCMLSLNDAKRLAASVQFDLASYLHEYAE